MPSTQSSNLTAELSENSVWARTFAYIHLLTYTAFIIYLLIFRPWQFINTENMIDPKEVYPFVFALFYCITKLYAASKLLEAQESQHPNLCEPFLILTVIDVIIESFALVACLVYLYHFDLIIFIVNVFTLVKDIGSVILVLRCHKLLKQVAKAR